MPTLEERMVENIDDLEARLIEREEFLDITPQMSEYIEMMEKYLLKLEERVVKIEKQMREEYIPIHITAN
ncbi:MAG: hypothetical protein KKD44_19075 [Proteobacteria bacterium]|nr:hypothetical protein [Pseudomonadota bacterium]